MPVYQDKKTGRWFVKGSYNGKSYFFRKENHKQFITKRDAQIAENKHLAVLMGNIDEFQSLIAKEICEDLVAEYIKQLFADYEKQTAHKYLSPLNKHILPLFEGVEIGHINNIFVRNVNKTIHEMDNYKDKGTLLLLTKRYLQLIKEYGSLNIDLTLLKGQNRKSKFMDSPVLKKVKAHTTEEANRIIAVIDPVKDDPRDLLLFTIFRVYGTRMAETRGIKPIDFDLINNELNIERSVHGKVGTGKSEKGKLKSKKSYRKYPLFQNVIDAYLLLLDYMKKNNIKLNKNDYIFYSNYKKSIAIGESTIHRRYRIYCARAGVEPINIHAFRHTVATELITSGINVVLVAAYLGHSSPEVTYRYYFHLFRDSLDTIKDFYDKNSIN